MTNNQAEPQLVPSSGQNIAGEETAQAMAQTAMEEYEFIDGQLEAENVIESNAALLAVGTMYGVGVGPGDPELITVKACRLLKECPVIAYPAAKKGGKSYAGRSSTPM